jgi:hypothetical protein
LASREKELSFNLITSTILMESSIQLTKEDFESKLNTIVELNTPEEVIQGLDVLLQVVCPVLDLQPGQDRSE